MELQFFHFRIVLRDGWPLIFLFSFLFFFPVNQTLLHCTNIEDLPSVHLFWIFIWPQWFNPEIVWTFSFMDNNIQFWFISILDFVMPFWMIPQQNKISYWDIQILSLWAPFILCFNGLDVFHSPFYLQSAVILLADAPFVFCWRTFHHCKSSTPTSYHKEPQLIDQTLVDKVDDPVVDWGVAL